MPNLEDPLYASLHAGKGLKSKLLAFLLQCIISLVNDVTILPALFTEGSSSTVDWKKQ